MPYFDEDRLLMIYSLYLLDKKGGIDCPEALRKKSWHDFITVAKKKKLVLFGSGNMCAFFLGNYPEISSAYIVDSKVDDLNRVEYIYNKSVYSPAILGEESEIVVLITPTEHIDDIYRTVQQYGVKDVFSLTYLEYAKLKNRVELMLLNLNSGKRRFCEKLLNKRMMERSELIRVYKRSNEARALINAMRNQIDVLRVRADSMQKRADAIQKRADAIQKRQTERYLYFLHTDRVVNALIDNIGDEELKKEQIDYYFSNKFGNEYRINFDSPRGFNEKNIVMQLNEAENQLYARVTDKYELRQYVSEALGSNEYMLPIYGVWDKPDEIDFDALPNSFVLKATNGGDGNRVIIVRDKSNADIPGIVDKMLGWTGKYKNVYYSSFNGAYKHVKPRIIAEEYISEKLYDYKFWMFHGEMRLFYVGLDTFNEEGVIQDIKTTYYDQDGNRMSDVKSKSHPELDIEKTDKRLDEMKSIAKKLAKPFDFVRVDFFVTESRYVVSELTLTPSGGLLPFDSVEMDYKIGGLW